MDFLNKDTTNYDVVFIGSSRVFAHISPKIIDSMCGVNSTCIAISGSTITQQLALLRKYFQRHRTPRLIILGLDYSSLQASMLPFRYPDYYEYLDDSIFASTNTKAVSRFKYRKIFEGYDLFMRYSGKTDYQKIAGVNAALRFPKKFDNLYDAASPDSPSVSYKGFTAIKKKWSPLATKELDGCENLIFEQQGEEFLQEFAISAKQHSANLVVVFTPAYSGMKKMLPNFKDYFRAVENITAANHVPFWNYVNDTICSDTSYFYNAAHLNEKGAEVFSETLGTDINKYLKH